MISRAKQTQRYQDAEKEARKKKERELKAAGMFRCSIPVLIL
jgi:hypothetical protein